MRSAHAIARWTADGLQDHWFPTELHRIGKSEEFLEIAIAQTPKLLCLESRRTGIGEPFVAFRQVALPTPTGHVVYPDIVFLAASGHVVAVEVKLSNNPELRRRDVIAQILDYASSLSRLDQRGFHQLLNPNGSGEWFEFVQHCFPTQSNTEELAETYLERIARGQVNIVIACDKVPPGLSETVSSLSSQAALGFECDVVEIVPFVCDENDVAELLFVPSIRLSTEIVARTAVDVVYRPGDAKPQVTVQVTSVADIPEKIVDASQGKKWTPDETAAAVDESNDPVQKDLFIFAQSHSDDGQVVTDGLKKNASFGLHLRSSRPGATSRRRCIFSCPVQWRTVWISFDAVEALFSQDVANEFRRRVVDALGTGIDASKSNPGITTAQLAHRLEEFKCALSWLVAQPR